MFGFGKKKEKTDYQETQTLAMEILELFHKTVEHELDDIDNYFKEKLNRNHTIMIPMFYQSKVYLSPDYIGYFAGLIEGYLQDKKLAEQDMKTITIFTVSGYSKTIVNHRSHFGLSPNEGEFSDTFMDFLSKKTFLEDEDAGTQMMMGRVEGSALNKALKNITDDYSSMLQKDNTDPINLTHLRKFIRAWSGALLLDKKKLNFLEASFLENGEWNPNVEEDWEELNKISDTHLSSIRSEPKKKKSISKFKKFSGELIKFIENYEFTIKDDEDYYEHDITLDEENNQLNSKIDVYLKSDTDRSYPFIEFIVDFSEKKVSFNSDSIESNTYGYQDIDDLKDIIEEEISKS